MKENPLYIEKMIHGGYGLARGNDGPATMIRLVLPGETVQAKKYPAKKDFVKARLNTIIQSSPERIIPPCPYFSKCGGCDFQHCNYPTQLRLKKEIVQDLLFRSGHPLLRNAASTLTDPIGSEQTFNYRQRIRLWLGAKKLPGFRFFHSHQVIETDKCLLAAPAINDCLEKLLSEDSAYALLQKSESLELMLNPAAGTVVCIFHLQQKFRPNDKKNAEKLLADNKCIEKIYFKGETFSLTDISNPAGTVKYHLSFQLPPSEMCRRPITLSWEAGGFCQVNLNQNQKLINLVLAACNPSANETILDLFCGMGNFSIPLGLSALSVLGIEGQGSAIRSAGKNSLAANLNNTQFEKSPIDKKCNQLVLDKKSFDHLIIDPPRQGIPGMAGDIAALTRKRLVYISCDPATLCRDLADLIDLGFHLTSFQLIDMFPQTHHIESVVLLEKN